MKGEWLDWMILWVFSNLSDSVILRHLHSIKDSSLRYLEPCTEFLK